MHYNSLLGHEVTDQNVFLMEAPTGEFVYRLNHLTTGSSERNPVVK